MNNFTKVSMTRLLLILAAIVASAKSAKIYNALISSDENLTPSHAYPVVEPVLRTTALGVAFPPIIVHPTKDAAAATAAAVEKKQEEKKEPQVPELAYHGTLYPLAYDPYFPYAYTSDFLFPAALPFYQQPVFVDFTQPDAKKKQQQQQQQQQLPQQQVLPLKDDPLKAAAAANFKKNPEIPDVPPPPLPVKTDKERKKE